MDGDVQNALNTDQDFVKYMSSVFSLVFSANNQWFWVFKSRFTANRASASHALQTSWLND